MVDEPNQYQDGGQFGVGPFTTAARYRNNKNDAGGLSNINVKSHAVLPAKKLNIQSAMSQVKLDRKMNNQLYSS